MTKVAEKIMETDINPMANLAEIKARKARLERSLENIISAKARFEKEIRKCELTESEINGRISEIGPMINYLSRLAENSGIKDTCIVVSKDKKEKPKRQTFGEKIKERIKKNLCTTYFEETGKFCNRKTTTKKQKEMHMCKICLTELV